MLVILVITVSISISAFSFPASVLQGLQLGTKICAITAGIKKI